MLFSDATSALNFSLVSICLFVWVRCLLAVSHCILKCSHLHIHNKGEYARNCKIGQMPLKIMCTLYSRKMICFFKNSLFRIFCKWPSSNYFTWYMLFRVFLWHDLLQLKKPPYRGTYHHNCHVFLFARDFKSHHKVNPGIPLWIMSCALCIAPLTFWARPINQFLPPGTEWSWHHHQA